MEDRPKKRDRLFSQLKEFYPEAEPKLFNAISTRHLKNHHIGCALSHRAVIQEAKNEGYARILVFEEDCIFHKEFNSIFPSIINELKVLHWDLFYPGACIWETREGLPNRVFESAPNSSHLVIPKGCTCTHGIGYNESIYDTILDQIPNNIDDMMKWIKTHAAIDQWLMYRIQNQGQAKVPKGIYTSYMSSPRICSQPFLIGDKKQDKPRDFKI